MKESVENLLQAIAHGDALETEKAFGVAMAEKLAPMLDARRVEVAQSMFSSQQQETVSEEAKKDDEEDEDESEEKEDEDENEEEDKQEMKEAAYTNPGLEALLAKKRAEKAAAAGKKTS